MNAETVKEFWNHTLGEDANVDRVIRFTMYDYGTGREITIDGALVKARDSLYQVFLDIVQHLEANPPIPVTPATQARETYIAHFAEIIHLKKTYYVEEHKDGNIVIQTPQKNVLDNSGKIGMAILEKYQASKSPAPPPEKEG